MYIEDEIYDGIQGWIVGVQNSTNYFSDLDLYSGWSYRNDELGIDAMTYSIAIRNGFGGYAIYEGALPFNPRPFVITADQKIKPVEIIAPRLRTAVRISSQNGRYTFKCDEPILINECDEG